MDIIVSVLILLMQLIVVLRMFSMGMNERISVLFPVAIAIGIGFVTVLETEYPYRALVVMIALYALTSFLIRRYKGLYKEAA